MDLKHMGWSDRIVSVGVCALGLLGLVSPFLHRAKNTETAPPPQPRRAVANAGLDGGSPSPIVYNYTSHNGVQSPEDNAVFKEMLPVQLPTVTHPLYFAPAPLDGGALGGRTWNGINKIIPYNRIYVSQPDGGMAMIERSDAGDWVAHGMRCAE